MPRSRSDRARKRKRVRRGTRTSSTTRSPTAAASPSATGEAETRLLALARELTALPAAAGPAGALHLIAAAYAPNAPLPRAVARAWIRGLDDKTAALALAWAREQVRLALEEILARAPARAALPGSAETRSRLLLAAAEAIAHEPAEAGADRLHMLLALTGG
jgi:hypothetical protein